MRLSFCMARTGTTTVARAGSQVSPPPIRSNARGADAAWAPSLITAAVAVGRMPGEPATILAAAPAPTLLTRIFGFRRPAPLSDPRLEVLRAISASLTKGVAQIGEDLVAAAHRAGWNNDDLHRAFPGVALQIPR